MSASVKNFGTSNDTTSVTKISAHARIDYILRFSKQAILVIDESIEQNAAISGQFLASLPEQHNAAYISPSAQLNNIQIRCRVIEQLYTGELFDPEISLAVSVINLAKKSPQSISIVFDNAQHLSLQILHELSQLAAIAKKTKLVVNIVIFGSPRAGKLIADNKSIFDNKMALLSAQSGQLLSTTSVIFKNSAPKSHFIKQNKWLIGTVVFLLGLTAFVMVLLQQSSFNFSQPIIVHKQEKVSLIKLPMQKDIESIAYEGKATSMGSGAVKIIAGEQEAAIPEDIFSLLTNPSSEIVKKIPLLPASPADIISAMTVESALVNIEPDVAKAMPDGVPVIRKAGNTLKKVMINNDYYAEKEGYVIQLAAFRDLALPIEFLNSLSVIDHYAYQRTLNNKPLVVITSAIYAKKSAAESALAGLPKSLLARKPWIKPVTVINNEINVFLDSQ